MVKKILIATTLLWCTTVAAFAQSADSASKAAFTARVKALNAQRETRLIGKQLPNFSGKCGDTILNESHINGKIALLNFINVSNPMCKAEMDALNRLYNKLKDSSQAQMLVITYEDSATIAKLKTDYSIQYPIVQMNRNACTAIKGEQGFPTMMIVDKKGIIRKMHCGMSIDADVASQIIVGRYLPDEVLPLFKEK
jgi:peroxiredoxin